MSVPARREVLLVDGDAAPGSVELVSTAFVGPSCLIP